MRRIPSHAIARSPMTDPKTPVLCLLDALTAEGFKSTEALWLHSKGSVAKLDGRRLGSKRFYFQCLIARRSIYLRGQKRFRSDQPQAYYKWLLRAGGPIPEQATARGCNEKLVEFEAAGQEYTVDAALMAAPSEPAPGGAPAAIADIHGDDGDEELVEDPPPPIGDEDPPEVHGDGGDGGFEVPDFVLGQPISLEVHWRGGRGLRVQCHCHHGCSKYRSLALDAAALGPAAARQYLSTWLAAATTMGPAEHRAWKPTVAQIRAHMADA